MTGTLNDTMAFKQLCTWVFIIAVSNNCDCVLFAQNIPPPETCERQCDYSSRGKSADCRSRGFSEIPIACKDVLSMDFSLNELPKLDNTSLEQFTNLRDLTIKQTHLSVITPGAFHRCSHITRINLAINLLQTLPTDAFSNLPALEVLILDENRLTHLEDGCLRNLSSLKQVYLNSNNLSFFNASVFQDCGAVENLYLSNNRIVQIYTNTFFGLSNLKILYMESNGLKYIFEDAFNRTTNLKSLMLNNNLLSTFNFDILEVLVMIEKVQLSNNKITYIEGTIQRDVTVKLQNNPIICNCSLQRFVESARTNHVNLNATCAYPPNLANVEITKLRNFGDDCEHESLEVATDTFTTEGEDNIVQESKTKVTFSPFLGNENFLKGKTLYLWIVAISVWSMIIFLSFLIFKVWFKRKKEGRCSENHTHYSDTNRSHFSDFSSTSSNVRSSSGEPIYLEIPDNVCSNRNSETETSSLVRSDSHEFPTVSPDLRAQPIPEEHGTIGNVDHFHQHGTGTLV